MGSDENKGYPVKEHKSLLYIAKKTIAPTLYLEISVSEITRGVKFLNEVNRVMAGIESTLHGHSENKMGTPRKIIPKLLELKSFN